MVLCPPLTCDLAGRAGKAKDCLTRASASSARKGNGLQPLQCAASQLCFRHYLVDKYAAFSEPVGPRKTPHNAGVRHEPSP